MAVDPSFPSLPNRKTSGGKIPGYQPLHHDEGDRGRHSLDGDASLTLLRRPSGAERRFRATTYILAVGLVLLLGSNLYTTLPLAFRGRNGSGSGSGSDGRDECPCRPSKVPQYFQTTPELWPGPTATGRPAFMAQTRIFDPSATYVPNQPLQTAIPIHGKRPEDRSIFQMMGYLSPYAPSPGFGIDEHPLPPGADIVQVQMLSRHGSRYPTAGSHVAKFGERVAQSAHKSRFKGALAFLQDWRYHLGYEILVPKGREELFQSGVLHSYMYGSLYSPESKIIVRTTTEDRMLKSAENWLAGFFGLEWTNNATIEVIIEEKGFNNSLSGSLNCPNAFAKSSGSEARDKWIHKYLRNATERFQASTEGFAWNVEDVYAAQSLCPYETAAYGFSRFCELFTYEEWQGFGYSVDLYFSAVSGWNSPAGRAVGLGYQQEVVARLRNHTLGYSGSQINVTLDSSTETFPLNQSLYFDFSHDTNIVSVLTAFGLRQFAGPLTTDKFPGRHNFTISHMTPFGARLDIEIIRAPHPIPPDRAGGPQGGGETKYVHFILNQRTLPLGVSLPECDADRIDGWCELDTFLKVQDEMVRKAQFDHACFGDYPKVSYGDVTDGSPP